MSLGRIESAFTPGQAVVVVTWDDGRCAGIDLDPLIAARAGLAPLRNSEAFRQIHVAEDGWSVEWPICGIDLGSAQLRRWAEEQA